MPEPGPSDAGFATTGLITLLYVGMLLWLFRKSDTYRRWSRGVRFLMEVVVFSFFAIFSSFVLTIPIALIVMLALRTRLSDDYLYLALIMISILFVPIVAERFSKVILKE